MIVYVLGAVFLLLIALLIRIVRNGFRYKEDEAKDIPGDYCDYGEPPYNSYKYN